MKLRFFTLLVTDLLAVALYASMPQQLETFMREHCYDCHEGSSAESGLDLSTLDRSAENLDVARKWARLIDRVAAGEMPPEDASALTQHETQSVVTELSEWLRGERQQIAKTKGRVPTRRLTNLQLERSLHDLLAIDIPLASKMSDEPRTSGFVNVVEAQSVSHFHMEQHVRIVDAALDEAFGRALGGTKLWSRKFSADELVRRNPRRRTREPELRKGQAVTWNSTLIFYGRLPVTTVREDGWYRFTIKANALKPPQHESVWCTARAGKCVSSAPLLSWIGAFETTPDSKVFTVEGWMNRGDMLEVRPCDKTLRGAKFRGGQVGTGEGEPQDVPGIAIDWLEMERYQNGPDDDALRKVLFGDFKLTPRSGDTPQLSLTDPVKDIRTLLTRMARRAFRRPVAAKDIEGYLSLATESLRGGASELEALRTGYRSLLCSPRFMYLYEPVGKLDQYAVASRLSYFLTGAPPDWPLRRLAQEGRLLEPETLKQQTRRLLAGAEGERFVKDLSAQWLDLALIDFTEPDRKLYPGFDIVVQQSMLEETQQFLLHMLRSNSSVTELVDADFTYLNSRLSRYYGLDLSTTGELQRVSLPSQSPYGGLLTQGAIMKVTANGTTTSPVIRGVWISERLLGESIPPPPDSVPAIEPDVRGAKSIRDMLEKHKSDAGCAVCHRKIDPPGYALENFDPSGRWRTHYGSRRSKSKQIIDASYELPDGGHFDDLHSFQQLVNDKPQDLARNVAEKLIAYGTGATTEFSDRQAVDSIVTQAAEDNYGLQSLIEAVVTSPIFLTK